MADSKEHIKLHKAPLCRAICQMQFYQLFDLNDEKVSLIQKALLDEYPNASRARVVIGFEEEDNEQALKPTISSLYRFSALEGQPTISLTDRSVSLETTVYKRFADFSARWEVITNLLEKDLGVRYQSRLGFRYTNVVRKQKASSVLDWQGTICDSFLAAEIGIAKLNGSTAKLAQHQVSFSMSQGAFLVRYGSSPPPDDPNLPEGFLIDIDTYDDEPKRVDFDQQKHILAQWNHAMYRILRWSVTDDQWVKFEPEG